MEKTGNHCLMVADPIWYIKTFWKTFWVLLMPLNCNLKKCLKRTKFMLYIFFHNKRQILNTPLGSSLVVKIWHFTAITQVSVPCPGNWDPLSCAAWPKFKKKKNKKQLNMSWLSHIHLYDALVIFSINSDLWCEMIKYTKAVKSIQILGF